MPPFYITILISFSFNHAVIFCINTCASVLKSVFNWTLSVTTQFEENSNCTKQGTQTEVEGLVRFKSSIKWPVL